MKTLRNLFFKKGKKQGNTRKFRQNRKLSNTSSSGSETHKLNKTIKKVHNKLINIDKLVESVDDLHKTKNRLFKNKASQKKSNSPNIMLQIRNLDNGKEINATVIKDLNTGKYDFLKI